MNTLRTIAALAALTAAGDLMAADAPPKAVLQTIMLTQVNPQGLALWDITNNATSDGINVDPKKIKAAQWAQLLGIGKALEAGGKTLATSNGVVAAPRGAKLQDERPDGGRAVDVQRFLDANPALFRSHAQTLQQVGAKVITAADKRDVKALSDIAADLDEVCEACHVDFWYPDQKKK
jgi:hypothetical protein